MRIIIQLLIAFIFCHTIYTAAAYASPVQKYDNNTAPLQPLHVGDKMPDVLLGTLLNTSKPGKRLSEIAENKFIVIDFFATYCVPCVEALPQLDRFQKKYKDNLVIIAVSNEPLNKIKILLQRNTGISIPFIAGDSTLDSLFPHTVVPHEVWIDKIGVIKAITSDEELTDEHLYSFVNERLPDLPVKSELMDYKESLPLFQNGNGGDGAHFFARSIFTRSIEGAPDNQEIFPDSGGRIKRLVSVNIIPLSLFYMAYSHLQFGVENFKRIFFETRDSTQILKEFNTKSEKEFFKYCVCYEYIPAHSEKADSIFNEMLEDINRYFPYYGKIEKRTVPCWVLKKTSVSDSLLRSHGGPKMYFKGNKFRNFPLKNFVSFMNNYHQIEPVIDGTNYTLPVDIDISFTRNINEHPDFNAVKQNLNRYGLDLVKENRSVDVLVLKDKN